MRPDGKPRKKHANDGDRDDGDPFGFDETTNYFAAPLRWLVPQRLAVWGLHVGIELADEPHVAGESVAFTVVFENRLPVPVELETESSRIWRWSIDGEPFASDERPYIQGSHNSLSFRARERKVVEQTWNGRFRRDGDPVRWIAATPGTYTLEVVLETSTGAHPAAVTSIDLDARR